MDSFKDSKINTFENVSQLRGKAKLIEVPKNEEKGFNFGYLLVLPDDVSSKTSLIVEGPNYNKTTYDIKSSKEEIIKSVKVFGNLIYMWNEDTNFPILIPIFPKVTSNIKTLYTHMLTSPTLNHIDNRFKRIDRQLIHMIDDARDRLKKINIDVDEKIIIDGFSASAKFANRFTILHPNRVKLCIAGGVSGCLTLPIKKINGETLIFPVGVGNLDEVDDQKINEFLNVKQFYYMGLKDNNDPFAAKSNDCIEPAYSSTIEPDELKQLYKFLGHDMTGDRWENTQKIYNDLGVNAIFESYEDEGHRPHMATERVKELLKEQDIHN